MTDNPGHKALVEMMVMRLIDRPALAAALSTVPTDADLVAIAEYLAPLVERIIDARIRSDYDYEYALSDGLGTIIPRDKRDGAESFVAEYPTWKIVRRRVSTWEDEK